MKISHCIAPVFFQIHSSIKQTSFTYFDLSGGRGSTKSSFVGIEIVQGMMRDPLANAVALRQTANTLRDSVFEQIGWAIEKLKVSQLWDYSYSPLKWVYKPTGQKILFRGCDDPVKIKSIKFKKGYPKYIWFEETQEFKCYSDIQSVCLTLMRSCFDDDDANYQGLTDDEILAKIEKDFPFVVFKTGNPPANKVHWYNIERKRIRKDKLSFHSTYLDVPKRWLTKAFLDEAEECKARNQIEYDNVFLGLDTGLEGLCYPMFSINKHVIDIENFKWRDGETVYKIICGCDGGTIRDATTLSPMALTNYNRVVRLPLFYYDPQSSGHQPLAASDQVSLMEQWLDYWLGRLQILNSSLVTIVVDSAAQDLVLEFNKHGKYQAVPVPKKDVLLDMKRVQGMLSTYLDVEKNIPYWQMINAGYIDPVTFKKISDDDKQIEEFYYIAIDEKTKKPVDGNDHATDGLKYGTYLIYYGGGY